MSYVFQATFHGYKIEGRFWNQGGKQIAIIASITSGIDWGAYIGTDAPFSSTEQHITEPYRE